MKRIHGWGRYPVTQARVDTPLDTAACRAAVTRTPVIARGNGRSYGDSANNADVVALRKMDRFVSFDRDTGVVCVAAGMTIRELIAVTMPAGWFVAVSPGTSFVTIGGAIASDVHGKNHHHEGTFGEHVISMTIMLADGSCVVASASENTDLFHATCGGMGLTGVIVEATLRLKPIASTLIEQTVRKARSLEEICGLFVEHAEAPYSVAWIDCLARGDALGRSVLMLGEHADKGGLEAPSTSQMKMPFATPGALLNRVTMKAFNAAYYARFRDRSQQSVAAMSYFYPLDAIADWNKLYGRAGFVQYQCVVPEQDGVVHLRRMLTKIAASGQGSFLAVLKKFGEANANLLSFPMAGFTLALDFKVSPTAFALINTLDAMLLEAGGRVYLTKDAVMSEATFKTTYPQWQVFETVREKYGAVGHFASDQSRRLGLA
ncbi:MAG: FAD-binding oxidoreductase [Pseudomonadota bacterium]